MKQLPKTIEVENIFGSHSTNPSDHISYFGLDGFPIYDEHGVEAYITYGFDCPAVGGRDYLYDKEFLLDFCLGVSDDTAKLNGESDKSLVGEIKCVELTLDGEVLTLEDPFKIQGNGSKDAFYIFALLKKKYEKILAAKEIRFKVYGADAFFDGVLDAEAFHLYSVLFYKLAEKRKERLSQANDYCINVFPDESSINEELSGDEDMERYVRFVRGEVSVSKMETNNMTKVTYDENAANAIKSEVQGRGLMEIHGLKEELRQNIELQRKFPGENTCTNIDEETRTVNIQVCKSGMVEGLPFDKQNDTPGLDIVLRFFATKVKDIPYWNRFKDADISKSFKLNEVDLDGETLLEYYADFGEDYVGAAAMVAAIVNDVYRLNDTAGFTFTTWSDGGSDHSLQENEVEADNDGITYGKIDFGGGYYYIGEIKDGKAEGKGASYTPDGKKREEGTYHDGELNGFGITYVNGKKFYEGHFVNGEKSGKGALYAMGHLAYEGDFLNGNRHGKGTQWWPRDNSRYEGDFKHDKRTGRGVLYIDNIKRYEGDFVDGNFEGNGTFYDENGNVAYSGLFKDNRMANDDAQSSSTPQTQSQGCYIATAVYGSYDCPEVWALRRFRDYKLDETALGRLFIRVYYATSPTLVKWFGNSNVFKAFFRRPLNRFVDVLRRKGYKDTPYNDKY